MRVAVVAVSMCWLGVATGCADGPSADARGIATVVEIIDGDTIDVAIDGRQERIRLIGIDTPETRKPDAPIECYGPEASAFTARLLPVGATVRVERDVVGRDDYGRLLGYVHRVDADGAETFVNLEIVAEGYAQPLTIEPNSAFATAFAAAAREAERQELGMWGTCSS
jgi:micrococcal nuclease